MEVWGGNAVTSKLLEMTGINVWVDCQPHQGAKQGGDVYYLSACASGRVARLMLADVSGHGERVSHIARDLRGIMRRYVNYISQRKFLMKLNSRFEPIATLGQFATGIALSFFGPTRSLTLCNFGHPMPLIYRAKTQEWNLIDEEESAGSQPSNLPLGIVDSKNIQQWNSTLHEGDAVLCYTDGFSEARDEGDELLGPKGIQTLVREFPLGNPEELNPYLCGQLQVMHPDNLSNDDMTLMLIQANGTTPSLKDNLLAPYRLLSGLVS